jgi:hypothetical protein
MPGARSTATQTGFAMHFPWQSDSDVYGMIMPFGDTVFSFLVHKSHPETEDAVRISVVIAVVVMDIETVEMQDRFKIYCVEPVAFVRVLIGSKSSAL